jgi:hypothetical protein
MKGILWICRVGSVFLMVGALRVTPLPTVRGGVHRQEALSREAVRGRAIYLNGATDGGMIYARIGESGDEVPATVLPCASCHGSAGEGVSEGGIRPSPLYWESLTTEAVSGETSARRKAYDEELLARAIRSGVDPDGRPPRAEMPRHVLSPTQMADLIAFLKTLHESDR